METHHIIVSNKMVRYQISPVSNKIDAHQIGV